jgi:hypothetical protein
VRKVIVSNFVTLDGLYEGTNKRMDSLFEGSGNLLARYQVSRARQV